MYRNVTSMEIRPRSEATSHVSWHPQLSYKPQNNSVSTMNDGTGRIMNRNFTKIHPQNMDYASKSQLSYGPQNTFISTMNTNNQDNWHGRPNQLPRNTFPRTPYPSRPIREKWRYEGQEITNNVSHSDGPYGPNGFPKIPYPASPTTPIQESLYDEERDIASTATFPPSPTATTASTISPSMNRTPHLPPRLHPTPPSHHMSNKSPTPTFSSSQPHLPTTKHHGRNSNPDDVHAIDPATERQAVRLRNPAVFLERRLQERRRRNKHQALTFSKTTLVHEYDQAGQEADAPMRPEGTKFHGEAEEEDREWSRAGCLRRSDAQDARFHGQGFSAKAWRELGWCYCVTEGDGWVRRLKGKDLSGREERLREEVRVKRVEEERRSQAEGEVSVSDEVKVKRVEEERRSQAEGEVSVSDEVKVKREEEERRNLAEREVDDLEDV